MKQVILNKQEIEQAIADKEKIYTLSLWPDGHHEIKRIVETHDYRANFVVIPKNVSVAEFVASLNGGAWQDQYFNGFAVTELFQFELEK